MAQLIAGLVFFVGAIALGAAFFFVASRSAVAVPYEQVSGVGYRIRRYWFGLLLVAAVVTLIITIPQMPYRSFRESAMAASDMVHIRVVGQQWAWQMSTGTVPVGKLVEFDVTSKDVNHGFAIYSPDNHIVGQVQAMPGFTNTLVMRFDKPGTYQIRCLELCGLYHQVMTRTIQVTG
ncbi:MAG TPA: cytochrome c oxidase subunit II [Candidatus Dormibacteraeota bacterium]